MAAKKTSSSKTKSRSSSKSALSLFDSSKKQVWLTVGFIFSLIMFAVVFINAGGLWGMIRNLVFGIFGFSAFLVPFFGILVIVMTAIGKSTKKFKYKTVEAVVFYTLLISFIFIINADVGLSFSEQIKEAYNTYKSSVVSADSQAVYGYGVYGAFFGSLPFLITEWNRTAAGAITVILLLVVFMLFTGTTILKLIHTLKKPADAVTEYADEKIEDIKESCETVAADVHEHRARSAERRRKKAEEHGKPQYRKQIDIPLTSGTEKPDMGINDIFTEAAIEKEGGTTLKEVKKRSSRSQTESSKPQNPAPYQEELAAQNETQPQEDIIALFNKHTEAINEELEKTSKKTEAKPFSQPDKISQPVKKTRTKPVEKPAETPEEEISENDTQQQAEEIVAVKEYQLPPIDCLLLPENNGAADNSDELRSKAETIVKTLASFGVGTKIVDICRSPSVTRFELQPDPGVKISRITTLSDDIAMNLAASGVRIEAPIPNKNAVGIEVPNSNKTTVTMREILDTQEYKALAAKSKLTVALGRDIQGAPTCTDLSKMPHLLVAGTTGSGKSVCMNTMIVSILFNAKPDEVKLIMIDPKKVEFTLYSSIPHLLVPVVTDPRKAAGALSWAASEMDKRYAQFAETGVRNLQGYNKYAEENSLPIMPQIVIFIDELAELMMVASKEVEDSICRLAQKARAAGMHLVIATQRPSVDVITGLIKANIPSRIALAVKSQIDSRTIIDTQGAEKLLGNGDMLFCPVGLSKPSRVQGAYLRDEEIENVIDYIKAQGEADFDAAVIREMEEKAVQEDKKKGAAISVDADDDDGDEMVPKAIEVVVECGAASTTLLQRKLKLGYARAARIIDELAEKGIIGPYEGAKPRKVLITKEQWYEMQALSADKAPVQLSLDDVSSDEYSIDGDESDAVYDEHNYFGAASVRDDDGDED